MISSKNNSYFARAITHAAISLFVLTAVAACSSETVPVEWDYGLADAVGPQNAEGSVPVLLTLDVPEIDADPSTKSRFSESACSGYNLLVYESSSLYTSLTYNGSSSSLQISLRKGKTYTIFVMRNMWRVKKSSGARECLYTPISKSSLLTSIYRVDGADEQSGYRYLTFAETVSSGIPACGYGDITVSGDPSDNRLNISLKPLFAKVTLTIDQSALEGSSEHGYLTGSSIYVRNVNAVVSPFGSGSRAASTTDILPESDYDNPLAESSGTYTLYAPENMSGTVPGISSSSQKNYSNAGSLKDVATYLEYKGTVNSGTGISGPVTYRFYLGSNATTDFNLERGRKYAVSLSFKVNSLLGDGPVWKIDASGISDSRKFYLSKTQAGAEVDRFAVTTDPASMQRVVVRRSRPNVVYPKLFNGGSALAATYEVASNSTISSHNVTVTDLASSKFVFSSEELASLSSSFGIGSSYDSSTGGLTFKVTNASLFSSHLGEEATINAYVVPGYERRQFRIRLMDDITISVADGLSLSSGFYIGMSRAITVSNVYGSSLNGTFTTVDGTTSGQSLSASVNLEAGTFNAIKGTAESYSIKDFSSAVRIYAIARNASDSDKSTSLRITFADSYNNAPLEFATQVIKPKFRIASGITTRTYALPVDGSVTTLEHGWYNNDGTALSPTSGSASLRLDADLYTNIMEWFNSDKDLYYTATYPKWKGTFPGDNNRDGVLAAGQFLAVSSNPNPDKPAMEHRPAINYEKLQYLDNGTVNGWFKPGNRLRAFIGSFMNDVSKATMATGTNLGTRGIRPYWVPLQGDDNLVTYSFTAAAPLVDPTKHFEQRLHYEDWFDKCRIRWNDVTKKADCDSMVNTVTKFKANGNSYFEWIMNDPMEATDMTPSYFKHAHVTISAPDVSGSSSLTWSFKPLRYDPDIDQYYAVADSAPIGEIKVYSCLDNIHSGEGYGTEEESGIRYVFIEKFESSYYVHLKQINAYSGIGGVNAYVHVGNPFYLELAYLKDKYPDFSVSGYDGSGYLCFNGEKIRLKCRIFNDVFRDYTIDESPTSVGESDLVGDVRDMPVDDGERFTTWTAWALHYARTQFNPAYPYATAVTLSTSRDDPYEQTIPYSYTKWTNSSHNGYLSITSSGTPEGYKEYLTF